MAKQPKPLRVDIAVINNGFVFIGEITEEIDPQDGKVKSIRVGNCKNIRRWGTTKGLGEIALGGPTSQTILDESGVIRVPYHSLIFVMEADQAKWAKHFT